MINCYKLIIKINILIFNVNISWNLIRSEDVYIQLYFLFLNNICHFVAMDE